MNRLNFCALIFTLSASAAGQTASAPHPVRPVFSSVPFWTPGGPPPEYADTYFVYLDYGAKEYVVSYPKSLASGALGEGRLEFRIDCPLAVEPEFTATVQRDGDGTFRYEYAVTNGASAKRALGRVALIAAVDDESIALTHPTWSIDLAARPQPPDIPGRSEGGPALRIRAGAGRLVSWTAQSANALSPSSTGTGFQIRSRFLPGITPAFGSSATAPGIPVKLPPQVQEQLDQVQTPENRWNASLTIGPKFNPDDGPSKDPVWIANDYALTIEKLRVEGRVASGTPFLQELTSILSSVATNGQRMPVVFHNKPAPGLEAEIANAVRLALSSE